MTFSRSFGARSSRPSRLGTPLKYQMCVTGAARLDVAHPLAANLGTGHLDAAALADDALEAHALVLAAVALPVGGTEDLLAERAVTLGLQRAVVDGFRLLDLTVAPRADVVRGGQADLKLVEEVHVDTLASILR